MVVGKWKETFQLAEIKASNILCLFRHKLKWQLFSLLNKWLSLGCSQESRVCTYFTRLFLFPSHAQTHPRGCDLLVWGKQRWVSLLLFFKILRNTVT